MSSATFKRQTSFEIVFPTRLTQRVIFKICVDITHPYKLFLKIQFCACCVCDLSCETVNALCFVVASYVDCQISGRPGYGHRAYIRDKIDIATRSNNIFWKTIRTRERPRTIPPIVPARIISYTIEKRCGHGLLYIRIISYVFIIILRYRPRRFDFCWITFRRFINGNSFDRDLCLTIHFESPNCVRGKHNNYRARYIERNEGTRRRLADK